MFFLFAGDEYDAGGGMHDYVGAFPTIEAAKAHFNARPTGEFDSWAWANIATVRDGELVKVAWYETHCFNEPLTPLTGDYWKVWSHEDGTIEKVHKLHYVAIEAGST